MPDTTFLEPFPFIIHKLRDDEVGPGTAYPVATGLVDAHKLYWLPKAVTMTGTVPFKIPGASDPYIYASNQFWTSVGDDPAVAGALLRGASSPEELIIRPGLPTDAVTVEHNKYVGLPPLGVPPDYLVFDPPYPDPPFEGGTRWEFHMPPSIGITPGGDIYPQITFLGRLLIKYYGFAGTLLGEFGLEVSSVQTAGTLDRGTLTVGGVDVEPIEIPLYSSHDASSPTATRLTEVQVTLQPWSPR